MISSDFSLGRGSEIEDRGRLRTALTALYYKPNSHRSDGSGSTCVPRCAPTYYLSNVNESLILCFILLNTRAVETDHGRAFGD